MSGVTADSARAAERQSPIKIKQYKCILCALSPYIAKNFITKTSIHGDIKAEWRRLYPPSDALKICMLFALIYYFALYSGVAAQVARSNTVARHFTQTPRCGNIEVLLRPHSRFHQFRGKERKRGACVRRACDRVSGSRNASGGRVQSMIVCVYTSAVPRMRRVVRNGCLRRTAPQALRGGSLCGFPRKWGVV